MYNQKFQLGSISVSFQGTYTHIYTYVYVFVCVCVSGYGYGYVFVANNHIVLDIILLYVPTDSDGCRYYNQPCQNGGVCHTLSGHQQYHCACTTGWAGDVCTDGTCHGPLDRYVKCGLAIPTCITTCARCMLGSLTSSFLWSRWRWENVPGIPGACTIRKFTYLTRGPCFIPIVTSGGLSWAGCQPATGWLGNHLGLVEWTTYISKDNTDTSRLNMALHTALP